jgi:hypothetical protein
MRLREDAQKLREKKTKLEGMVESHDKLIMQFADKCGYNRSDEDADDGDEHDNDGGNAAAPLPLVVRAGSPNAAPNPSSFIQAAAFSELCSPERTMRATLLAVNPFVQVAFIDQHSSSSQFPTAVVETVAFSAYHMFEGMQCR